MLLKNITAAVIVFVALGLHDTAATNGNRNNKPNSKPSSSNNNVQCNDYITKDTTLTRNLNCDCSDKPALIVTHGADLDLAGYTVSCRKGSNPCIELRGDRGGVANGKLSSCKVAMHVECDSGKVGYLDIKNSKYGIVVADRASHNEIKENTIHSPYYHGIVVKGDGNYIKTNTIREAGNAGIFVKGPRNEIIDNWIADSKECGIYVCAPHVKVTKNEIHRTKYKDGIRFASRAENGIIEMNKIYNVKDDGIDVEAEHVVISENEIKGSAEEGIDVEADHVTVKKNKVMNSGEHGIAVTGDDSEVCFNRVHNSKQNGILFGGDDSIVDENEVRNSQWNGIQIGSENDSFRDDKRNNIYQNDVGGSKLIDIYLGPDTSYNNVTKNTVEENIVEVSDKCEKKFRNSYKLNSVTEKCVKH